ncbi:MAG: ferritin-like domain-containing protein, partial [Bdellovibrionota bacterium]
MSNKLIDTMLHMRDSVLEGRETPVETHSRRVWLQNFGLISASAAVAWACGGDDDDNKAIAQTSLTPAQQVSDAGVYNVALGLEHEAITLYDEAIKLTAIWDAAITPLAPAFKSIAESFKAHHTTHRNAIIAAINANKTVHAVEPVAAKTAAEYLTPYPNFTTATGASGLLRVLQLAAEREMNAANTYHSVLLSFNDKTAIQTLGGLSSDESAHYGVLNA